MRIEPGTKAILEFPGHKDRISSMLLGMDPGRFLIVRLPFTSGIRGRLAQGNAVVLRYFQDGVLFGFKARVLHFIAQPEPLLFLEIPFGIETLEVRRHHRVSCTFPAEMSVNGLQLKGLLRDLSAHGCRMTLEGHELDRAHLPGGDRVEIAFFVLEQENPYKLAATVQSVALKDGCPSVGLKFSDDAGEEARAKIGAYVEAVLTAMGGGENPGSTESSPCA